MLKSYGPNSQYHSIEWMVSREEKVRKDSKKRNRDKRETVELSESKIQSYFLAIVITKVIEVRIID